MALILSGADVTAVYEPDADGVVRATEIEGKTPALGDIFWGTGGKVYKFVKYDDGSGNLDMVAGDAVFYVDDSGYAAHTVMCDSGDASGAEIGAGICQGTVTVDGSYFWIQIKGHAILSTNLGGSGGDGQPFTMTGAADKAVNAVFEVDSTGAYKHVCGVIIDETADEVICDFPF